jgi:hypothetical protein
LANWRTADVQRLGGMFGSAGLAALFLKKNNTMELKGEKDIEKAVFLLREIDAFLSFNISPPPAQMTEMRKTIQEFTSHFPDCWKCGDTGFCDQQETIKCTCL